MDSASEVGHSSNHCIQSYKSIILVGPSGIGPLLGKALSHSLSDILEEEMDMSSEVDGISQTTQKFAYRLVLVGQNAFERLSTIGVLVI